MNKPTCIHWASDAPCVSPVLCSMRNACQSEDKNPPKARVMPPILPTSDQQAAALRYFQNEASRLVTAARANGVVVTIDIESVPPLAMGRVRMVPQVRLARELDEPRPLIHGNWE